MARNKRKTGDTGQAVRDAVGGIFSCGTFAPRTFELTGGIGTQLSLTGALPAVGNGGTFDETVLVFLTIIYSQVARLVKLFFRTSLAQFQKISLLEFNVIHTIACFIFPMV